MAWTQEQLDAIESAIANGTLSVEYADKKVTYRSLEDLLRVRDLMRKALGLAPRVTRYVVTPDKGHGGC